MARRTSDPRDSRLLVRLTVASWVASFATVVALVALWRLERPAPSAFWAVASVLAVGVPAAGALLLGLWRAARGPQRLSSLAFAMVATTPVVWSGVYVAHMVSQSRDRHVPWTLPARVAAFWACSAYDLETRLRYPRHTAGRHVVLIDNGRVQMDRERLTRAMDAHVEEMAAVLGRPVPPVRIRWVRGPVFGIPDQGRAILAWAVCAGAAERASAELTPVDRHEVAHCLITMLAGPDHRPPTLLVEGWAEYQGSSYGDHDEQVLTLADLRRHGRDIPLAELVEPALYHRSIGPAYTHGGPLVRYLLERFGPATFLDLYRTVRPATFASDCQRVLGTPGPQLESDFWQWLDRRAAELPPSTNPTTAPAPPQGDLLELAPGVSPADWFALVAAYNAANPDVRPLLREAAFGVDVAFTRIRGRPASTDLTTQPAATPVPEALRAQVRVLIRPDGVWLHGSGDEGFSHTVLNNAHTLAVVRTQPDAPPDRDINPHLSTARARQRAADAVRDALGFHIPTLDPAERLPLRPGPRRPRRVRVEEIVPPAPPARPDWTVRYRLAPVVDGDAQVPPTMLVLDPAHAMHVKLLLSQGANGRRYEVESHLDRLPSGEITFSASRTTFNDPEPGVSYRAELTRRPLTDAEQRDLQRTVETVVYQRHWAARLKEPLTIAIAWPAAGLLLGLAPAARAFRQARRRCCRFRRG